MQLTDSHCHVSTLWYEPIETLTDQMNRNGVAQAVLVQILGQFDNSYQQACAREHPERFASVVAVDPTSPHACETLAALAERGAAGVRLRPDARSPGADPLAIWRTAAARGLAISCVGNAERFSSPEFFALLEALPELVVVLEHFGGTSRPGETLPDARGRVFDVARYPNVYLKLPGFGELATRPALLPSRAPTLAPDLAELDAALTRFGPERLMWGSDFPFVCAREGYGNALRWMRDAIAARVGDAHTLVFGETARRVFRLPELH